MINGKGLKMRIKKGLLIITLSFFTMLIFLFFILNSFIQVELTELNGTGELQNSYVSPNGEYRADLFLINKGGATVSYQSRISITSLTDNKKKFNDETIYWLYPAIKDNSIEWKDNDKIIINKKTIIINDPDTYYNWKKDNDL